MFSVSRPCLSPFFACEFSSGSSEPHTDRISRQSRTDNQLFTTADDVASK